MTATDDFLRELRAACENRTVRDWYVQVEPTALKLVLDIVAAAPRAEPCVICQEPTTWTLDVSDWGREWRCETHRFGDEPDALGMAAIALEAHLKERAK